MNYLIHKKAWDKPWHLEIVYNRYKERKENIDRIWTIFFSSFKKINNIKQAIKSCREWSNSKENVIEQKSSLAFWF